MLSVSVILIKERCNAQGCKEKMFFTRSVSDIGEDDCNNKFRMHEKWEGMSSKSEGKRG